MIFRSGLPIFIVTVIVLFLFFTDDRERWGYIRIRRDEIHPYNVDGITAMIISYLYDHDVEVTRVQNQNGGLNRARRENDALRRDYTRPWGPSSLSKPARPYINAIYTYNFDVDCRSFYLPRAKAKAYAAWFEVRVDRHWCCAFTF